MAAFHLALGPDGSLYVTAPTLAHDVLYRVTPAREVQIVAADSAGRRDWRSMHRACCSSLTHWPVERDFTALTFANRSCPDLVIAAPHLVGVAFDPRGGMLLASHDTIWRI